MQGVPENNMEIKGRIKKWFTLYSVQLQEKKKEKHTNYCCNVDTQNFGGFLSKKREENL